MGEPVEPGEGGAGAAPTVVVSPHLDDAVLSTWWALRSVVSPLVVTVFAAVPGVEVPAANYDRFTGSSSPAARYLERQAEDRAVMTGHGWPYRHLGFLDNDYRDEDLDLDAVAGAIAGAVPSPAVRLLVPGAIGGHADHVAARDAALIAADRLGAPVTVYADLPYSAYFGWPSWVTGAEADPFLDIDAYYRRWLDPAGVRLGDPVVHRLTPAEQEAKLAAMRRYATQFPSQEGGPSRWLSHRQRLPYELSWDVVGGLTASSAMPSTTP